MGPPPPRPTTDIVSGFDPLINKDSSQGYDYLVLLSGSDYPLRNKEYIHDFFDKHNGDKYISAIKIYSPEVEAPFYGCASYTARKYDCYLNTLRIPSNKLLLRIILKSLARLGLVQRDHRKLLGTLEPYFGSMWWALTRDTCEYILAFVKANPSICKYYENTFVPDEMFFHTILGNSMFVLNGFRRRFLLTTDGDTAILDGLKESGGRFA